jgi:hypothetical protein
MIKWLISRLTSVDAEVDYAIRHAQNKREIFTQLAELGLNFEPSISCVTRSNFDIDYLNRDAVLEVLRKMGGTWDKTPADYGAKMNYVRREKFHGRTVKLCAAEPPPTCRVVEEEVVIPAQPEQRVMRKKLVCTDTVHPQDEEPQS